MYGKAGDVGKNLFLTRGIYDILNGSILFKIAEISWIWLNV